ncbi:MAG: alpha/beta hydrolase [Candidatus Riflebacteria bacterium]|nr:alpha/beta hydrolase [Candidatus Riflebacteria bacterium]
MNFIQPMLKKTIFSQIKSILVRICKTLFKIAVMMAIFLPMMAPAINIFHRPRSFKLTPKDLGFFKSEDVSFQTEDGVTLRGWLIPAGTTTTKAAVVFCHGTPSDCLDQLPKGAFLASAGYSCLFFDFRAQGRSEGHRITYGLHESKDVSAAVSFIKNRLPNLPIGIYGESCGATNAILAAKECTSVGAFVLDSTFGAYREMIEYQCHLDSLPSIVSTPFERMYSFWANLFAGGPMFDVSPVTAVGGLGSRPVLFIASTADNVVPFKHSQKLYDSCTCPKELWLIPGISHCGGYSLRQDQYKVKVLSFLDKALVLNSSQH